MDFLNKVKEQHDVNFIFVYIQEAHADDEWPIDSQLKIDQHRTTEERVEVAKRFVEKTGFTWPVFVDPIDNGFDGAYASWPVRAYVIRRGVVEFILNPHDPGYIDLFDLVRPIQKAIKSTQDETSQ